MGFKLSFVFYSALIVTDIFVLFSWPSLSLVRSLAMCDATCGNVMCDVM